MKFFNHLLRIKNKSIIVFRVLSVLFIGISITNAQNSTQEYIKANDTLVVYRDVPGLLPSDKYTIRIKSAATMGEWVSVYANYTYNRSLDFPQDQIKNGGNINYHYQTKTADWSHTYGNIEMSKNTEVEVEIAYNANFQFNGQPITKAAAHPSHIVSSLPIVTNGKVYFTINKPGQVYIDINGQMDDHHFAINPVGGATAAKPFGIPLHAVSLFVNPLIKKPSLTDPNVMVVEPGVTPSADLGNKTIMYFKPGKHNIGVNFKVYPNKTYYIPGDAIVYGGFTNIGLPPVNNTPSGEKIEFFGYGTISQQGIHHPLYTNPIPTDFNTHAPIFIENFNYGKVSGITFVDSSWHTGKLQADIKNPDQDKVRPTCKWVKVITWRSNGDGIGSETVIEDSFFRTTDDASYINGSRKRCVFWRDLHAGGFHMAGIPNTGISSPIVIEDCDAIYLRSRDVAGYNGGIFHNRGNGFLGQQTVNLIVRNFRSPDKLANSPFFNMYTQDNGVSGSSYTGIVFQNINIDSDNSTIKQVLTGSAEAPWDGGITFDNVTFKGVLLTKDNFTNYFITNAFTKNIIFKNSTNYSLVLNNATNGSIVLSSKLTSFADGTIIKLRAIPEHGYEFVSWTGDLAGSTNPADIVMNTNKSISATFQKATTFVFNTPGSDSWIVPAGVTSITLKSWGAGGAGGSAYCGTATANTQVRGGGGAGGSFAGETITVTPGQVINFTIGAGGLGAASGFADLSVGASGGVTTASFNNVIVVKAVGGIGGVSRSGTNTVIGGNGGVSPQSGNTGTIKFYGGNGGNGGSGGSGGGGGSAGELGNGGNAAIVTAGVAGLGGGANGGSGTNSNSMLPISGSVPGSGGGGAVVRNNLDTTQNNLHRTGAIGANGKLMIIINQNLGSQNNIYLSKNTNIIYPNPVAHILNIDFPNGGSKREIKIVNLLGQVIYSTTTEKANHQVDMKSLNVKGVVVIQISGADGVSNQKVIVK